MDLRSTLNLPDPDFTIPMKADLARREPEMQAHWNKIGIDDLIQSARRSKPKFILHDGPPYTNSPIHIGTALNKSLKDFVVKYKTMRGFHAPYVPGYDNHGLPIEMAVQAKLGKNISPEEMRDACRAHAEEFIEIQTSQFQRLGVFGDWRHRYATMDFGFEATIVRAFAKLAEKGFVYRDLRPTHWSTHSRTALADTELEYREHTSKAIFVRFPLKHDPKGVLTNRAKGNIYTIIWTTTPWTIPANLAVAFHPELDYALVECENDFYLLYDGLVPNVMNAIGKENWAKVAHVKGAGLEGTAFSHPIFDRDSVAVLADYVTTEDGTGVVHTAPGHGADDFYTGKKYGLPILCPVDAAGFFTEEAGEFAGQHIKDADRTVVQRLAETGHLLKAYDYEHSYPYAERDGHPVIFRTTEQWFLNVDHDNLRAKALEEIDKVSWFPKAGKARISAMVSGRPDWCLSRQRTWGVGIPIVYGAKSGEPVLDPELMERVAKLVEQKGSAAWFSEPLENVLPENYKHPKTGETEFRKETDVLDVWFDSGITHYAVLDQKYRSEWQDLEWPAQMYLEGSDQHRGWFNSSLMTATAICGHAPYSEVLTHGFVVDEKGEKMSKRKGNVIEPIQAANQYGADILRLWAASVDYSNDVPCGDSLLKQIGESYRRIRNTLRFLLSNLYDYDPKSDAPITMDIDQWAMNAVKLLEKHVCEQYDEYDFSAATQLIHNFCAKELSSFYLDAIKDRMYCDGADWPQRRSGQRACSELLHTLTKLIAPILPHTAEETYAKLPLTHKHPTVFIEEIDPINETMANEIRSSALHRRFETFFAFRDSLNVELESWKSASGVKDSQDVFVKASIDAETAATLSSFGAELPTMLRISWIELADGERSFAFSESEYLKCERSRIRRPDVELIDDIPLCARCRRVLGK
ncbi:MAG: isoleucine--tRNA ligase [Fimbriimonadales bacterium]|nr:isoleucine--tRNA ligase [Fimbriimonadales bacterium]